MYAQEADTHHNEPFSLKPLAYAHPSSGPFFSFAPHS